MLRAAWALPEAACCHLLPAQQLLLLLVALVVREMLLAMALLLLCERCLRAYANKRCRPDCWRMLLW
jgi:hypothetical protein